MAKRKQTRAEAAISGDLAKNPQRYRAVSDHFVMQGLGDPPDCLLDTDQSLARTAWRLFEAEAPWLDGSHRALIELAATLRGELLAGNVPGVQRINSLRQILMQAGLTPATASKVTPPDGDQRDSDDEFFDGFNGH